jgi:predicted RNA-binding protein with PIN domain
MHVIIDGYNLLAVLRPQGGANLYSDAAREALMRVLAEYRHRKGHALTVVFDGWQREFTSFTPREASVPTR